MCEFLLKEKSFYGCFYLGRLVMGTDCQLNWKEKIIEFHGVGWLLICWIGGDLRVHQCRVWSISLPHRRTKEPFFHHITFHLVRILTKPLQLAELLSPCPQFEFGHKRYCSVPRSDTCREKWLQNLEMLELNLLLCVSWNSVIWKTPPIYRSNYLWGWH